MRLCRKMDDRVDRMSMKQGLEEVGVFDISFDKGVRALALGEVTRDCGAWIQAVDIDQSQIGVLCSNSATKCGADKATSSCHKQSHSEYVLTWLGLDSVYIVSIFSFFLFFFSFQVQ